MQTILSTHHVRICCPFRSHRNNKLHVISKIHGDGAESWACELSTAWHAHETLQPRRLQKLHAIGFELPGSTTEISSKRKASQILSGANSLLLYRSFLNTKPAESFLKFLRSLQLGNKDSILEAYGAFYLDVASTRSLSWRDYVLEQILAGWAANPWVKAASRGEEAAHLQKAAQCDLDSLQSMALTNQEMVALLEEAASDLPSGWLDAALASGGMEAEDSGNGGEIARSEPEINTNGRFIHAPASRQTIQALKQEIFEEERWSTAAPKVYAHYKEYGYGLTGSSSQLQWSSGSLQPFIAYSSFIGLKAVPERHLDAGVVGNLADRLSSLLEGADNRALAASCATNSNSFAGEDNVEYAANLLLHEYKNEGLRTVLVNLPRDTETIWELRPLLKLLAGHPRVCFAVVLIYKNSEREEMESQGAAWLPVELRNSAPANVEVVTLDLYSKPGRNDEDEDEEDETLLV